MSSLPPVHIAIMQPAGYVHSLAFVDTARYVRWQFRRMGAEVTLGKNRLREDAVNIVFGAHLGFPAAWRRRHACLFFNLEQLGAGGANVSADYLQLLRSSAVIDYDAANIGTYCSDPADVPVVPFLHAPYLDDGLASALEDRPIDLLFFGSMNPRRRAFIDRVESHGLQVSMFDHAIYDAERDHFIRQAKAVINCHFYESSRFEQVRAFHCLSLGTPVISERSAATLPPPAFDDAVFWLTDSGVEAFCRDMFKTPAYYDAARAKLAAWRAHDPLEPYADLLAFAVGFFQAHGRTRGSAPWQPRQVNLGSGKDYKAGWLNVDVLERAEPDAVLDLAQPITLPMLLPTRFGGTAQLEAGGIDRVYANNVLEHVPDLPMLMSNVLALLKDGGEFEIEVPYEKALTAWQDPTHLRALNENSWVYYTDWFWYLGWFTHRFEIASSSWLDAQLRQCNKDAAAFMRVTLRKIETTARERTVARAMRPDFGGVDDDLPASDAVAISDAGNVAID
jgi:SAM-dependent methyltransferase